MIFDTDFFRKRKEINSIFNIIMISIIALIGIGIFLTLFNGMIKEMITLVISGGIFFILYFMIKNLWDVQNDLAYKQLQIEKALADINPNIFDAEVQVQTTFTNTPNHVKKKDVQFNDLSNTISDEIIIKLHEEIVNAKKPFSNNQNLASSFLSFENSWDFGHSLLKKYTSITGNNLIKEIIKSSSNFDIIKNNMSYFIKNGIVSSEYPHKFIE